MPFYTFKCPSCKKEKEVLQGMNDKPPICDGVKMKRILIDYYLRFENLLD